MLSYVNAVSEIGSTEPPPQLHGGIIADPMGLGKTLTMIALVATDLLAGQLNGPALQEDAGERKEPVPTTLIIVPPAREYQYNTPQTWDMLTVD